MLHAYGLYVVAGNQPDAVTQGQVPVPIQAQQPGTNPVCAFDIDAKKRSPGSVHRKHVGTSVTD
jgi:hypothetical protein